MVSARARVPRIVTEDLQVVDRDAAADRIVAGFAAVQPSPDDLGRSEDEIMSDTIAEIAQLRRERRHDKK